MSLCNIPLKFPNNAIALEKLAQEKLVNLNQVTLAVFNINRTKIFYLTLGFELIVDTPHYLRFACPHGGSTFSFRLDDKVHTSSTIYFEHETLDDWVDILLAKGIQFLELPTDQAYLWREAILKDPSGNIIKLYWAGENRLNPPWRVNNGLEK